MTYFFRKLISVIFKGRWGGIWRAPRDYSFVATNNKQTNVELMRAFDKWKYDDYGIEKRMPWISGAKLTTSRNATGDRQWGTLIGKNAKKFNRSVTVKLRMHSTLISKAKIQRKNKDKL